MNTLTTESTVVLAGANAPAIESRRDTRPINALKRASLPSVRLRHLAGVLMLAGLSACGTAPGERAISGAGIGAGAGAALGAVTGMGVGTGAAIGAAAGGAAGGLTDDEDVYLGRPAWK